MFSLLLQSLRSSVITLLLTSSICYAGGGGSEPYQQLDRLRRFARNGLHQTHEAYATLERFWILAEENTQSADSSIQFIGLVERAQLLLMAEKLDASRLSPVASRHYTIENIIATFEALLEFCQGKPGIAERQSRQACIWAGKLIAKTDQNRSCDGSRSGLRFTLPHREAVLQQAWDALERAKLIAYQGRHGGIPLLYQCNLLLFNHFLPRIDGRQITEIDRIQLADDLLETFKRKFEYSSESRRHSEGEIFGLQRAIQQGRSAEEKALSLSTQAPKLNESEEKRELERLRRSLAREKIKLSHAAAKEAPSLSLPAFAEKEPSLPQPLAVGALSLLRSHSQHEVPHQIINATTQTEHSVYLSHLSPLNHNCFFEGIRISRQTAMDQLLANAASPTIREWLASELAEAFFQRAAAPEDERERLLLDEHLQNELDQFALQQTLHPSDENYQALLERCRDVHAIRSYILQFKQSNRMISIRRNAYHGGAQGMLDAIGHLFHIDIQVFEHPEDAQGPRLELIHHSHPLPQGQPAGRQVLLSLSTLASHFSLLTPAPIAPVVDPAPIQMEAQARESHPCEDQVSEESPALLQAASFAPQKRPAQDDSDSEGTEQPDRKRSFLISCKTCGKQIQSSHFSKHQKIHNPERQQFPCQKCEQILASKDSLQIHDRASHQNIKYPCKDCGKIYNHEASLQSHRKALHEDGEKSTCKICGHHFSRLSNLKKHMKTVHPSAESKNTPR